MTDKQSPDPTPDVENPSVVVDIIASATVSNTRREGSSGSTSKAAKLGFIILVVAGAVTLGVVLGRISSSDSGLATQADSASFVDQQNLTTEGSNSKTDGISKSQGATESVSDTSKYIESEYYVSSAPLPSLSILDGYKSCSDLETDITEALKLYINEFINNEAENNDIYANCDPASYESWIMDLFGYNYDAYYYYDASDDASDDANYTCSPAGNTTTSCATDSSEVPWVVTWHALDHAEGKLFYNETQARAVYEDVNASWAKRLYDPTKAVVREHGAMGAPEWCQLESWAYDAQCNGEAPTASKKKKAAKKVNTPLPKKTRSRIPSVEKQARSRTPGVRTNGDNKKNKPRSKNGGTENSYGQNSQNSDDNQHDKVVSDGKYIYAAYGHVLYTWLAADSTQGVSITHMPGNATECEWNVTEPCTSISKPSIKALYLGSSRLTVIVSQSSWEYNPQENLTQPIAENLTQPIVTDYGTETVVRVYDISVVTLGSPLKEVGHKALTGIYSNGGSIGDKTIIVSISYIDTYVVSNDLSRSQPQYCGLDTTSYKELAAETAKNQVQLFAKQIVDELDLGNDCSKLFQISTMERSTDEPGADTPDLSGDDFLGLFVHVSTFDMSSDFGADSDIPLTVAGSFTAGDGHGSIYLGDDFLALPSNVYKYNSTSETYSTQTFILGFDLSKDDGATLHCYGHIPGGLDNNYRMDKFNNHLRIMASEATVVGAVNWTYDFSYKIYELEIPSIRDGSGQMSVVGESENFADGEVYIAGSRFVEDRAYVAVTDMDSQQNNDQFAVVDLSDPFDPRVVGSLKVVGSLAYMQQIDINKIPYILGVGSETNYSSGQSFVKLFLIDVSTPSSPKITASYKDDVTGNTDSTYDFLSIRYLIEPQKLIIPLTKTEYDENFTMSSFADGFAVYDITDKSIIPAFNVTHTTESSYCYYVDASIPARSFVIGSELITIRGHNAISTDMQTGAFLSELDLDVGFNYSVCDDFYSYYYGYDYADEVGNASNATTTGE